MHGRLKSSIAVFASYNHLWRVLNKEGSLPCRRSSKMIKLWYFSCSSKLILHRRTRVRAASLKVARSTSTRFHTCGCMNYFSLSELAFSLGLSKYANFFPQFVFFLFFLLVFRGKVNQPILTWILHTTPLAMYPSNTEFTPPRRRCKSFHMSINLRWL